MILKKGARNKKNNHINYFFGEGYRIRFGRQLIIKKEPLYLELDKTLQLRW